VIRVLRFAVEHYLVVPLGVVVAVLWANTAPESYYQVAEGLAFVVNDIGMAFVLAFLMQEVVEAMLPGGTLHPWRRSALPVIAAVGGTLGAIAMYRGVVSAGDQPVLALGWPVAGAVDIAVGFLVARSIFGRHAAVTFLLLLTIASDTIGLILVSQRYPVGDVYPAALALIVLAIGAAIGLRRSGVGAVWPYVLICGTVSWFGCFWSGVHPALALLPIIPLLPHTARDLNPVVDRARGRHRAAAHFEYVFRYPVQVVALLFGLVNGGVLMRGYGSGTWAVLAAALVGRPVGILLAIGMALGAGLQLPRRLGWREMIVVAFAASSGFTFTLFFAAAVVPVGPTLIQIKIGALATGAGTLLALAAARLLRVGRFAA
jgi:NhaA family Na+:H+ antiporter